jgi:phosphoribosylformylglycinamidine synthase
MKSAIVVFPGTNRERDMAKALTLVGDTAPTLVWHGEADLPQGLDLVVLPGGFSYGDYLRSGAMGARSPIMDAVKRHAEAGGYVLGVCNGFQILTESGLLPGALMRNRDLRFICRDVHLRVEKADCAFTNQYTPGQVIRVPVAHHDGNFFADRDTLVELEGEGRVAFRYCDAKGLVAEGTNPNGSRDNIAGILSANRRVLGMMPHPEDLVDPAQGGLDGRPLFASITEALS